MPIGAFKLNGVAKYLVPSVSGDAPTIPTLTWAGGGWTTATFNNTTRYTTSALVGKRTDGWHYLYARGDSTAGRFTHNNNVNLSQAIGFTPTAANSTSNFGNSAARGGGTVALYSTATAVRAVTASVANWTATPTQTSVPTGALGTSIARTGGTNKDTAICAVPMSSSNTTSRYISFWNSSGTLYCGKYALNVGTATFALQSTAALTAGTTSMYNYMSAAGFTSGDNTGRFVVGAFTQASGTNTNYAMAIGSMSNMALTSGGATCIRYDGVMTATNGVGAGIATAWDDFTNSKFVAVGMVLDGTTIKCRAIKVTAWNGASSTYSFGTVNSSVATGAYQAKISRVNTVTSGFGMVLVTYLKSASGNTIYGKFISVDSSTAELTVGDEMTLGLAGDSLAISATTEYGVDCAKDGTNWAFTFIWSNGANGDGGGGLCTATG